VLERFDAAPDDQSCWRAHFEMMRVLDQTDAPDYTEMNRALAGALGVALHRQADAGPEVGATYLSDRWIAAPGAAEAMARLEAAGYPLIVISNTQHGQMEALLTQTGVCDVLGPRTRVGAVLDSQVLGIGKPDRRIFEMALTLMGKAANECVHVGDSIQLDVVGATGAGMIPIHVDPLGWCTAEDHGHTSSLAEFTDNLLSGSQR
jgi:FMN phosphatase YigB (HAD superfamily)